MRIVSMALFDQPTGWVGCVSGWVPWEDVSVALLPLMVVSELPL